jgi:hypothetical protein
MSCDTQSNAEFAFFLPMGGSSRVFTQARMGDCLGANPR